MHVAVKISGSRPLDQVRTILPLRDHYNSLFDISDHFG